MRRLHQAAKEPEVGQEADVAMNFNIPEADLVKALAELKLARDAGFVDSYPCFELDKFQCHWGMATFTDILVRAHPTDGDKNWGRCGIYRHGYTYCPDRGLIRPDGTTEADYRAHQKEIADRYRQDDEEIRDRRGNGG